MTQQPTKGIWVLARKNVFEDERQFEKFEVGRFVRIDDHLWIVDFFDRHVSAKPFNEVIYLNGQITITMPVKSLVKALDLFGKARAESGAADYYLDRVKKILVGTMSALKNPCVRIKEVKEEIQNAILHVDLYKENPKENYNSPTYFREHIGHAIGLALGLS